MKTNLFEKNSVIQGLSRLSKTLVVAGVAALMTLTQADARDHHHRRGHHSDFSRHDSRGAHYYRPTYRHAPTYYGRGWSRPGYYGAYPPAGYVNYRYLRTLPPGYRVVYRNGARYYYANGSYYWPGYYNEGRVFLNIRF